MKAGNWTPKKISMFLPRILYIFPLPENQGSLAPFFLLTHSRLGIQTNARGWGGGGGRVLSSR